MIKEKKQNTYTNRMHSSWDEMLFTEETFQQFDLFKVGEIVSLNMSTNDLELRSKDLVKVCKYLGISLENSTTGGSDSGVVLIEIRGETLIEGFDLWEVVLDKRVQRFHVGFFSTEEDAVGKTL